ncbi:hypothetical protein RSOL_497410 [Rhizoctonia solani AG-3 Rhs1AP]|uniref:Uncharacterized protein n=1 Tax=Rhizoctonia solani AG-3 Rhs1AP TaxID=1086054 RepID=X8JM98_9AGAM|nr:hypothetical protein RSOL_497410 [Rhizoctonia solani AG-3 Rhs1AP]
MAPVSRPLASSANSSIQKYSANRIQLPIVLDFQSDKGKEEIRNWYRKQPTTRFTHIEHRKETTGRFGHEFVVVHLDNSTVCRFDRRAREDMRGHALKDEGTISEDSAHVITRADTESKARLEESEFLISALGGGEHGLEFILAVCCGIQSHPEAKSYSLLHYNCYFFSWTLVTIIDHLERQRGVESKAIRQSAHTWIYGFCNMSTRETVVSGIHREGRSFWGRLIHPGRSTIGANSESHQGPSILPVDDYIRKGMNVEFRDMFSELYWIVDEILFPSQISSWLRRKVFSALQEGGRLGARTFLAEAEARSQHISKRPTQIDSSEPSLGEKVRFNGSTSSVVNMGYAYWPLRERVQRQAETKLMRYGKLIDTFIADSSDVKMWSDVRWSRSSSPVYKHITRRMADHFKQVEGYGFGKAERSIKRAEGSMTEIWESALAMMKVKSKLPFL